MSVKIGDFVVQDSTMPYPNTVFRVDEVDEDNFRGPVVFRLTNDSKAYPPRKGQWLSRSSFRVLTKTEIQALIVRLQTVQSML